MFLPELHFCCFPGYSDLAAEIDMLHFDCGHTMRAKSRVFAQM